ENPPCFARAQKREGDLMSPLRFWRRRHSTSCGGSIGWRSDPSTLQGPTPYAERRLKSWCYRPVLEELEPLVVIGSLLVRPFMPDGSWILDGISTPAFIMSQTEPAVQALAPALPAPEVVSVAPQPYEPTAPP